MRAATVLCFACLLSIAPPALCAAQAPARDRPDAAGTAVIRGRVTLAGSDQPLGRVDVRASSPVLKTARAVKTDASGRYEIGNLPAGRYVVSAVKTNFVTAAFGQKRPAGPGRPFDVADGQVATNVDFAMARAGVITGRVLDEFGDPFPDIQVAVLRMQYVNGARRTVPAQSFATSNDLGEFRLFGIAPGDYFISATYRPFEMGGESDDHTGYAATYFPGTGNIAEAQRITISPGQVVSGITIPLLPVRTARVSGVALDSSGKPMNGTMIMAANREEMGMIMRTGIVKPEGTFSISGLSPGEYVLRTNGGLDGTAEYAAAIVSISGSDITDIQLVGTRPATLAGRVVFDASAVPPRASTVRISVLRPNPQLSGGGNAVVKDDSSFELKTNPGHATIGASIMSSPDWRVKRVTLNGVDVTDGGLDIPANTRIAGLVVEMTDRFGELSGVVSNGSGEPERDCWVIAFAQDPRRWPAPTRYIASSRPGQDDRFHVRLPSGQYFVAAVSDIEPGEWQDPQLLARLRDRAVQFSIADGEKKSVELRIVGSR